jgi:hypothetical protein
VVLGLLGCSFDASGTSCPASKDAGGSPASVSFVVGGMAVGGEASAGDLGSKASSPDLGGSPPVATGVTVALVAGAGGALASGGATISGGAVATGGAGDAPPTGGSSTSGGTIGSGGSSGATGFGGSTGGTVASCLGSCAGAPNMECEFAALNAVAPCYDTCDLDLAECNACIGACLSSCVGGSNTCVTECNAATCKATASCQSMANACEASCADEYVALAQGC